VRVLGDVRLYSVTRITTIAEMLYQLHCERRDNMDRASTGAGFEEVSALAIESQCPANRDKVIVREPKQIRDTIAAASNATTYRHVARRRQMVDHQALTLLL